MSQKLLRYCVCRCLPAIVVLPMPDTVLGQDADDPLSGTLALATEYVFRGISQTDEKPQVQGQVTWSHESGMYLGVWSSNTHFGGPGNSMELDPFIGFARDIGDSAWSYDVGYWHYHYPGAQTDLDYGEVYGILTYSSGPLQLKTSAWLAPDYFGPDFFGAQPSLAIQGTATYDLQESLTVRLRMGVQTFDEPAGLTGQDYRYASLALVKTWQRRTLELAAHDTSGVEEDLVAADLADARLVARLAVRF